MKIISQNKKAYFDYYVEDVLEVGICLKGTEVKSIRNGDINLKDSFCFVSNGELFLKNCHISDYKQGSIYNQDCKRDRKLLLHKKQLNKLIGKTKEKGFTLVPLKVYFNLNLVKLEIGLCKGKHTYDKSKSLKEKSINLDTQRQLKSLNN